jgi:NAD(P)-dependent dehydrogenase (short-subunit alcohol dehydrogenase family)
MTKATVLVTGASRGIGRATTLLLAAHGWHVLAGVRTPEDGDRLVADSTGRVEPVQLDITSPEQIAAVRERLTGLDALVNNAGIMVGGPIEGVPLDDLRHQLEVNVVGQVAVTQAVLPLLRASHGRVVFVSSLSGRVATPMTGAYNASKFALEAVADALRLEVRPWRIGVSLVEPAQTDTDLWRTAEAELDATVATLTPEHRVLYDAHIGGMRRMIPVSQRMAGSADRVAAAIEKALGARRPRARYVVGAGPKVQSIAAQLTPTPVLDAMLRKAAGVPRSFAP